ncbi:MAG: nucleotidyltransferase domain-containing protein [Candidatus Freyarchaeota archaeon]
MVGGLSCLAEPYRSVVRRVLDRLLSSFGDRLVSLVVFGSVARGDARRDSDLDLLVVIDGLPRSRFKRFDVFMEALGGEFEDYLDELMDKGFYVSISPVIKEPEEASKPSILYLDMVEDSVVVYDRCGFFTGVLDRLRRRLDELGAERVWVGKKWYWRLKKGYRFGEVITLE